MQHVIAKVDRVCTAHDRVAALVIVQVGTPLWQGDRYASCADVLKLQLRTDSTDGRGEVEGYGDMSWVESIGLGRDAVRRRVK